MKNMTKGRWCNFCTVHPGVQVVSFDDWETLDLEEQNFGRIRGKPREKYVDINEMLDVIRTENNEKLAYDGQQKFMRSARHTSDPAYDGFKG